MQIPRAPQVAPTPCRKASKGSNIRGGSENSLPPLHVILPSCGQALRYNLAMVDGTLPLVRPDERPLRVLFLDLNSYFASCEQQEDASLRGKPIIVAPMESDSTCAIAASYEAKRFGIKTGTNVGQAKIMCPELIVVPARPPLYVHYHRVVQEVAETVLPIDRVCSIDEMRFKLIGKERQPAEARQIALRMKKAMYDGAGECLTCSVGVAPNSFLAKLATEMQKPDGLVILQRDDLPSRILHLKLTDFTGINKRMQARLNASGVFNVEQMYALDQAGMRRAFGSVQGERWWYLLRGYEMDQDIEEGKTLGHSHVLAPDMRTDQGCRDVLLRLIQKASARLRSKNLCACAMSVYVTGFEKGWKAHTRLDGTSDTITMNEEFFKLWETRDFVKPRNVGITFTDIMPADGVTPSLFGGAAERGKLNSAVDIVNQKFGKNSIYLAGMQQAKDSGDEKIAFNKTWLFSEGKGDNQWPDTFRGHPLVPGSGAEAEPSDDDEFSDS